MAPSMVVLGFATLTLCAYLLGVAVYNRFLHRLRHFPGPFWASLTYLWYFRHVRNGRAKEVHALHERYGDLVRIGPNHLAVRNADAIDTVFGPKNGAVWRKGEFYDSFDPHIPGARTDSFSQRDPVKGLERRRIIASLYSQGNILQYEPCVDRLIDLFHKRMRDLSSSGEVVDMAVWMKRYAFDVVGEIFLGRENGLGMLKDGTDYNNWCYLMDVMPSVAASITYLPSCMRTLYFATQLLYKSSRDGLKGMADVVKQAEETARDRWNDMQSEGAVHRNDMLTRMLEIVRDRGGKIGWTVADVQTEVWAVIWAGADTTGTALTSIFYHLHRHPKKLLKLRDEIEQAFSDGQLSYPVRFGAARKLPFLHAVITESMRVHSSVGLGLPREVPPQGADICGQFIPGNSEIVMSATAVQLDRRVFGQDAADWIPERWIECDAEKLQKMEKAMLQFGAGPRMCIGRHISQVEMYKLLPTIFRDFDFELLAEEWKTYGSWFHTISNVLCRIGSRQGSI